VAEMGPLSGIRVLEFSSSAPCAFTGMMLADMGADVVRIDRAPKEGTPATATRPPDPLARGRRSIALNLKDPADVAKALSLVEHADVVVEGFRPGVLERMGLDPETCAQRNPRLVYARVSGWGQTGEWRSRAGHDITFLALTGALEADRYQQMPPVPPSTYLSSFAGGGMLNVIGILAALQERSVSGRGQVVDAAMSDGAALLSTLIQQWRDVPGNVTVIDAPHYTTYACADGRYVAVGAIEPPLYAALLEQLGLDAQTIPDRGDEQSWPALREMFAAAFLTRDSAEWVKVFQEHDACVVPVLTAQEAAEHPYFTSRGTFADVAGQWQPGPVPKLSRTPGQVPRPAPFPGEHTAEVFGEWLG
jgi:alpha-methylacyl-CoA racemase